VKTKIFNRPLLKFAKIEAKFEFTATDTPQKNGKIERKFATLVVKFKQP
jgi:hypothetical protein